MKVWHSLAYAGFLASGVVGSEAVTPDKVEADVTTRA